MHWVISPEHAMKLNHPEHPYEPIEHEVTIQKHAIRRYCNPVFFSREDAEEVAKMLGTTHAQLLRARKDGLFEETFIPHLGGKPGPRVPLLSPKGELFDPGFGRWWARPHAVWGADWEFLSRLFPDDFEQTVERRPHFARINKREWHGDDPAGHWGWRWVCPGCRELVKTIYYPVPVVDAFQRWIEDSVLEEKLRGFDLPARPAGSFACHKCNGVLYFNTGLVSAAWNVYVTTISTGLLYGREVKCPGGFLVRRKRTRIRMLGREAPMRRKVVARLRNGWSKKQIAEDLGIRVQGVMVHIGRICREEEVADVAGLARKLGFGKEPHVDVAHLGRTRAGAVRERRVVAEERRARVMEMMLGNVSYAEMAKKLGVRRRFIECDVRAIYRAHGIKASGSVASKRALAEKLGVRYYTRGDEIRSRVAELREKGLTWKEVGREMGMKWSAVARYGGKRRGAEAVQAREVEVVGEAATKI